MSVQHPTVGVVILAAGKGERLAQFGPKVLLEIGGKPLLWYALDLARHFSSSLTVVALSEQATRKGLQLLNRGEKSAILPPLGTLDNVEKAAKLMPAGIEHLLICQSDDAVFYPKDIFEQLFNLYQVQNVNMAITTIRVTTPLLLGPVQIKDGRLIGFSFERKAPAPRSDLCGIYLFRRTTLEQFSDKIDPDEKGERTIPSLIKYLFDHDEPIAALELPEGQWSNINTPEDLERAQTRFQKEMHA